MLLDGDAKLQVEETATHFSAALFLDSNVDKYEQSMKGIWLATVQINCKICTGYSNWLQTDHELFSPLSTKSHIQTWIYVCSSVSLYSDPKAHVELSIASVTQRCHRESSRPVTVNGSIPAIMIGKICFNVAVIRVRFHVREMMGHCTVGKMFFEMS